MAARAQDLVSEHEQKTVGTVSHGNAGQNRLHLECSRAGMTNSHTH